VKGFEKVPLEARLKLVTDLKKNGGIESIEIVKEKPADKRP
jgi:hypothetical protein